MSEIDPEKFGRLCGLVEGIHESTNRIEKAQVRDTKDINEKLDKHGERITKIETRNKTVAKGIFGLSALWGAWKILVGVVL